MDLSAGTRLGPYEIQSPIGAGGMGEVYRARDTKLDRDVAIKILPGAFAHDAERLARFQREAKTLASLNHPNIAIIHGLEQVGDVHALVMELVAGEDLSNRLARGAIPMDDALSIAKQIAEALEGAHEQGIIHRDLKPANIKVRADGTVKVLDFGLAKLAVEARHVGVEASGLSQSPTLSLMATQAGIILGTAAYMSPEQAKGLPADQRSDVFAFGAVLYEMLSGHQPFQGDTTPDMLASVIVRDADMNALPPHLNPRLRELLQRCLEKQPKKRWQAIGDVRAEIEIISAAPRITPVLATSVVPRHRWAWTLAFALTAVVAAGVMGSGAWSFLKHTAPTPRLVSRFEMSLPAPLAPSVIQKIAISPDGRRIIYVSLARGATQLYSRSLDQLDSIPLQVPGGSIGSIFLSADGEWIGFNDTLDGRLRKARVRGGPAEPIVEAQGAGAFRGATWGSTGTIVFSTSANAGLMQVSDRGGVPTPLTTPKDAYHFQPRFLPNGRALLYTVRAQGQPESIAVLSLDTGEQRVLLEGSAPQFAASGHIVFLRGSALWAAPFDPDRLVVNGDAVPVIESIRLMANVGGQMVPPFDMSLDGTLVYSAGVQDAYSLVWVDRQGRETPIKAQPRLYAVPRVSPDGSRIAVDSRDEAQDIWIFDVQREKLTRFTLNPGQDYGPLWSPDGKRLVFASDRDSAPGIWNLYRQSADQTGGAERLTTSTNPQVPSSFSIDGKQLVFREAIPGFATNLSELTLDRSQPIRPLVHTKFAEQNGDISPDGRWLAYQSNDESGRVQLHVCSYPDVDRQHLQITNDGGLQPVWAPDGKELFYLAADGALMSLPVQPGQTFAYGTPVRLFQGPYFQNPASRGYDIAPDGRFLMIKEGAAGAFPKLIVIQNWFEELKRVVPTK